MAVMRDFRHISGLLLAAAAAPALAQAPVGMLLDSAGACESALAAAKAPCEMFQPLRPGQVLTLGAGATAELFYDASKTTFSIAGPATVTLGADAPATDPASAQIGAQQAPSAEGRAVRMFMANDVVLGAVRTRGGGPGLVEPVAPRGTVLTTTPVFEWRTQVPDLQYRFTLSDALGKVVFMGLVKEPRLQMPAEIVLEPELYYRWAVEAQAASGQAYSATAEFSIAPATLRLWAQGAQPAADAPFGERLLYAMALKYHGLDSEAVGYWAALLRVRPDSPQLQRYARAVGVPASP